jgi:hypothetical protein
MKVEFGFDVLQVARGNYAPQSYHDFIGFEVSKPVLERAFRATYSLELKDVFLSVDLALGTYRRSVSTIIPNTTRVAWKLKKDELTSARPRLTRREFVYNLSRAKYHKEWGREYRKPGIFASVLAFLIRIVPKIGPLSALSFKPPTPETEKLFEASFNQTLEQYRGLLEQHRAGRLRLDNRDFDTGALTRPAEYPMADEAYAELVIKLSEGDPAAIDPRLRQNVLAYYRDLSLPFATKKDEPEWRRTLSALAQIASVSGDISSR